jgi:hypothetical protein
MLLVGTSDLLINQMSMCGSKDPPHDILSSRLVDIREVGLTINDDGIW